MAFYLLHYPKFHRFRISLNLNWSYLAPSSKLLLLAEKKNRTDSPENLVCFISLQRNKDDFLADGPHSKPPWLYLYGSFRIHDAAANILFLV